MTEQHPISDTGCASTTKTPVILSAAIFMTEMKALLFSPELREGLTVCKTKKSQNNSERGCCTESSGIGENQADPQQTMEIR